MSSRIATVAALVAASVAGGCYVPPPVMVSAPFVHVVLWKARPGTADSVRDGLLRDLRDRIATIPHVKGLWAGRPVPQSPTPAAVLDADYDIGMLLVFEGLDDLVQYERHPSYLAVQQQYADSFSARVVDFSPYGGTVR